MKKNGASGRGRPRRAFPDGVKPNAFARWLARTKQHPLVVANILGISKTTIYSWRRGGCAPLRSMAVRIEHLSDGDVPVSSWDM